MNRAFFAKTPRSSGFALVVTLSLMILLTIIAVGLLTLSSISLRSSTATSAMSEARANARLSLLLALGELQKHAGPDQRITATADIAGMADGSTLAAGEAPANDKTITNASKGLSSVQPGTRYWTGVWKNANTSAIPSTELYTKTPSPRFAQWLVSGNEAGAFTPATGVCAVGGDGAVSDAKTAVVLVGQGTTGKPATDTISRYVAAPLVPIQGMRGAASRIVGRYGWWIGDEGVKARINTPITNTDPASYAALSAQRRGWESVAGFSGYPIPNTPGHDLLTRGITLPEMGLVVAGSGNSSGGTSPIQSVFHSATTDSMGVIADTLNGGTKVDLTSILSKDLPTSNPLPAIVNYPVKNTNIIPRAGARSMVAPKWDAVKEFYDRSKTLSSGSLVVRPAADVRSSSIAPLITDIRLLMGVKFTPTAPVGGVTGYKANACGKIAIAIANPYSQALKWERDLEFEVLDQTPQGSPPNRPSRIWNLGTNSVFISNTESAVFNKAIFRIRAGSLAPGEARAYTLGGYILRAIGTGTQRTVMDLAPFGTAAPFDFNNCVELDANGKWPYLNADQKIVPLPSLDVRESWQTTLVAVEMRLGGSSASGQPLRRVERFDLDNGYYGQNIRNYNADGQKLRTKPIPLMCYNFQISQPGVDYLSLMPAGYEMGQRSSTLRTFTDFNLQATRIGKPIASYNPPPYFMESNNGFSQLPDVPPGGDTGVAFTKNLNTTMPWGRGFNGSAKTVLFSVPSQFTSLAQFQHADLTGDDVAASIGHQPGNAFANSYAPPFVKRALTTQTRVDYEVIGTPNPTGTNQFPRTYYDISHLLNTSVWDSYFLSTIPSGSAALKPENPSLIRLNPDAPSPDLKDPVKCATQLLIDGAFNVNCTDKNAWKAFLASSKHFKHKADASSSTTAAFPRSLDQIAPSATQPTGTDLDSFAGFRRLTDDELESLATEIVKQVRLRGPFVSVSHFVNRALGDFRQHPVLTRNGALQAAIDESGATINLAGDKKALQKVATTTDRVTLAEKNGAPRADLDGNDTSGQFTNADPSTPDWAVTSTDNNYGAVASIIADRTMLNTAKAEQGYRSTGIPGWLTQADILQVIGPSINNRSDTFRVRAYGESIDGSGNTVAKAYCEAIVQRLPSFADPANPPSARVVDLNTTNKTYGRQFALVSFRWLSPLEI